MAHGDKFLSHLIRLPGLRFVLVLCKLYASLYPAELVAKGFHFLSECDQLVSLVLD